MFTIGRERRKHWAYEVRWNGGRTIARCDSLKDAQRIAVAMNVLKDRDAPLTAAELDAVDQACPR